MGRGSAREMTPGSWREQQRRREAARALIRLPEPGEAPLAHLLSEAQWRELAAGGEAELTFLSQSTGIYFFPSREWVARFCRMARKLRLRRVLEAGAGRGYLAAALAPALAAAGIDFLAVDREEGEYNPGLDRHPVVQREDALSAARRWAPDLILYAWPPPGQSVAALAARPGLRYLVVMGEAGGGCTGDPEDWRRLRHRVSPWLSRYGTARTGRSRYAVTMFFGTGAR